MTRFGLKTVNHNNCYKHDPFFIQYDKHLAWTYQITELSVRVPSNSNPCTRTTRRGIGYNEAYQKIILGTNHGAQRVRRKVFSEKRFFLSVTKSS